MPKITQNIATAPGVLPVKTPPAPIGAPPPSAPPGVTRFDGAKAVVPVSVSKAVHQKLVFPAGAGHPPYTITANDIGVANFQFGGHYYNLMDSLGRALDSSDVGHSLVEQYTPDGWVLTLT